MDTISFSHFMALKSKYQNNWHARGRGNPSECSSSWQMTWNAQCVTAKGLKTSLWLANISVCESSICKSERLWQKHHGRSGCSPNKNTAWSLPKSMLALHVATGNMFSGTMKKKLRLSTMYGAKGHDLPTSKNIVATVKYVGGSVIIWDCSSASGSGPATIIEVKINDQVSVAVCHHKTHSRHPTNASQLKRFCNEGLKRV